MNQNEFLYQRQAAVERMREMNARSAFAAADNHKMPPAPSFVNIKGSAKSSAEPVSKLSPSAVATDNKPPKPKHEAEPKNSNSLFPNGTGFPFIDNIIQDADMVLIIGLLLVLMSENADKRLLFALIYILL